MTTMWLVARVGMSPFLLFASRLEMAIPALVSQMVSKTMPEAIKGGANNRPNVVPGDRSPYPTVNTVVHQKYQKLIGSVIFAPASSKRYNTNPNKRNCITVQKKRTLGLICIRTINHSWIFRVKINTVKSSIHSHKLEK